MIAKLTTKQKMFVELYSGNGTEAARQAGYSGNNATLAQIASENLKNPVIRDSINLRMDEKVVGIVADRTERMLFWTSIMKGNDFEIRDRLKASELLAKVDGDFLDRKEKNRGPTLEELIMAAHHSLDSEADLGLAVFIKPSVELNESFALDHSRHWVKASDLNFLTPAL